MVEPIYVPLTSHKLNYLYPLNSIYLVFNHVLFLFSVGLSGFVTCIIV